MSTSGLLRSLIPNLLTEFKNSKWRIWYGDYNIQILPEFYENRCLGEFGVADSKFDEIQNGESNIDTIIFKFLCRVSHFNLRISITWKRPLLTSEIDR